MLLAVHPRLAVNNSKARLPLARLMQAIILPIYHAVLSTLLAVHRRSVALDIKVRLPRQESCEQRLIQRMNTIPSSGCWLQ